MARTGETPARLGQLLKEELKTTPLSRITVSTLTTKAGITRQAFYYHFSDVNDLASWVFMRDIGEFVASKATLASWTVGLLGMTHYMYEHREETYGVLISLDAMERDRFFFRSIYALMSNIVEEVAQDGDYTDAEREFVARHLALVLIGHVSYWLQDGMSETPEELVEKIAVICKGMALRNLEAMRHHRLAQAGVDAE